MGAAAGGGAEGGAWRHGRGAPAASGDGPLCATPSWDGGIRHAAAVASPSSGLSPEEASGDPATRYCYSPLVEEAEVLLRKGKGARCSRGSPFFHAHVGLTWRVRGQAAGRGGGPRVIKRLDNNTTDREKELRRLGYSSTAKHERVALPKLKRQVEAEYAARARRDFPMCCKFAADSQHCTCGEHQRPRCARAEVERAISEEVAVRSYEGLLRRLGGDDAALKLVRDARVLWSGGIGGWEKSPRGCLSLKDARRLILETELLGPLLVELLREEKRRVEQLLGAAGIAVTAGMGVILGSARGMVYDQRRAGYEETSGLDKHQDVAQFVARTVVALLLALLDGVGGDGDGAGEPELPPFFVEMLGWGVASRVEIARGNATTITALPSVLRWLESSMHHGSLNSTDVPVMILPCDWYLGPSSECLLQQWEGLLAERQRVVTPEVLEQWGAQRQPFDWRWIRVPGTWGVDDWQQTQSAKGK